MITTESKFLPDDSGDSKYHEKVGTLVTSLKKLHDYADLRLDEIRQEKEELWNKNKDLYKSRIEFWEKGPSQMRPEDANRYIDLDEEDRRFENEVRTILAELVAILINYPAEWKEKDFGNLGSNDTLNYRSFMTNLDDVYSFFLDWSFLGADAGQTQESHREAYAIKIEGSRKRGFTKTDFPFVTAGVSEGKDGEFHPETEFEKQIISLGQRLRGGSSVK
jgi:hypothetical protein